MELFAKRNNDTKSNSMSIEDYVPEPRLNFDNFFNAYYTVYQISTTDNWLGIASFAQQKTEIF